MTAMYFYINDNRLKYELEKLSRLFLPFDKFFFVTNKENIGDQDYIACTYEQKGNKYYFSIKLKLNGKLEGRNDIEDLTAFSDFRELELKMALMLFDCFYKLTGYRSPWGILTGIRPAKLLGKLIASNGEEEALKYFKDTFLVTDDRIKLCLDCYNSERAIIERSTADSFSLYISVPFCPSRCNYCSFVSHSVEQSKRLIPEYVEHLCKEIRLTADIAKEQGLRLKTIYIGGGTPTTLSAEEITAVMNTVRDSFDLSDLLEYTVEAGRPDTVTKAKLLAIKQGGATRISINPQTMNDNVLESIGRRHTVQQMVEAFNLARKCGFNNINTDLIAGLSKETYESFCHSVDEIIKLNPENVTVHTLSMKRASNLNKSNTVFEVEQGITATMMVDYANQQLRKAGIVPYYMYRQSKTVGNLENVGYAKLGFEGLYNVYIMDETHTILACGASAVTKLRQPNGDYIERIFNFKYPYEYINKFDTIIERKQGIISFYQQYGS